MDKLSQCIQAKNRAYAPPFFFIIFSLSSFICNNNANPKTLKQATNLNKPIVKVDDYAQIKNIPLPNGFKRIEKGDESFATWLQNIPLKKDKSVYLYDGSLKQNQTVQFAVLNVSIGNKNLQQCADAVMRLRAEYLFAQKRYEEIIFTDNDGTSYKFTAPFIRENFIKYLDKVFGMCGTASLSKQLKKEYDFNNLSAGNVFIRGGFPGHAVIVMDVAQNEAGEKIYLLAQSYMPAQDIHVLRNPMNDDLSPWYAVIEQNTIYTPEYTFYKSELKNW